MTRKRIGCLTKLTMIMVLVLLILFVFRLSIAKVVLTNLPATIVGPSSWFGQRWPALASVVSQTINMNTIEFSIIEAGSFVIGSPDDEPGHQSDERQREVSIEQRFAISRYEITNRQYSALIEPSQQVPADALDLPVSQVNWHDAVVFCQKLSAHLKKRVRLPTEAEWEFACRAGQTGPYGLTDQRLTEAVESWDQHNQHQLLRRTPSLFNVNNLTGAQPVGSFQPNGFGLFDMHGNVWEWCDISEDAPTLLDRPIRGGAWTSPSPLDCRSANRAWQRADQAEPSVGFRIVVEL